MKKLLKKLSLITLILLFNINLLSFSLPKEIENFSKLEIDVTLKKFIEAYLINLKDEKEFESALKFLISCDSDKAYDYLCNEEVFSKQAIDKFKELYSQEIFKIIFYGRLAIEKLTHLLLDQNKFTYPYAEDLKNSLSHIHLCILNFFIFKKDEILEKIDKENYLKVKDFLVKYSNPSNTTSTLSYLKELQSLKNYMDEFLLPKRSKDKDNNPNILSIMARFSNIKV